MENPNEYDDDGFTQGCIQTSNAIGLLWDAGATLDQISEEVRNALENCEVVNPLVEILSNGT